jgi:hypothetical protein
MILPTKHINLSESFIGLSGFLLKLLNKAMTIDDLWQEFQKVNNTAQYPAYHSFDNIILGINLLFFIGAIEIDTKGKIQHATS